MTSEEESVFLETIRFRRHVADLLDPIYKSGYEAKGQYNNPYEFLEKLDLERIRIAGLPRALTGGEKERLIELNKEYTATEWARYSRGNHYRNIYLCK